MTLPVRPFADAFEDVSRGNQQLPQSAFSEVGRLPVVDQGQRLIAGYTDHEALRCRTDGPVIVFGDHTRVFKYVDFPFVIGADGVKLLRVSSGWDPKYAYYYLRSQSIPSAGYSRHFKFLKQIEVPQPTLAEQRRISAILDHADALRAKRCQVLAHLDTLTQSIFHEMFGDPQRNRWHLPRATIGSIAEVVTGNSPPRADSANFGDLIEWIKSDNLGGDLASVADEWLSQSGRAKARVAPAGSILVTCIAGSPASIGKASMVDRKVAFNQQINAVLPSDQLDASFLLGQLKIAPQLVRAKSTGGMKGLVSKSAFQSIEILCPPLDCQRKFGARMEQVSVCRAAARRALVAGNELFASLQARAFRGEL